jgi:hypothetical protein
VTPFPQYLIKILPKEENQNIQLQYSIYLCLPLWCKIISLQIEKLHIFYMGCGSEMWKGGQEFYGTATYKLYCSKGGADKMSHDSFS